MTVFGANQGAFTIVRKYSGWKCSRNKHGTIK
jgi:hypothetical protein